MMKTGERNSGGLLVAAAMAMVAFITPASAPAEDRAKARELYGAANSLFDQGEFKRAAESYQSAIAEDPQFADARHNLALAAEMVDRRQAIEAWKQFIQIAEGREEYKYDAARIRARAQLLELMPVLPEAMQPARYDATAGDYYLNISRRSEGEEWKQFPIKVFLGSAPQLKWQQGARQAYDTWAALMPLQLVAVRDRADIRLRWDAQGLERGHAGEEMEWVEIQHEGDELRARRIAVISVDLSFNWGTDDMRAIVTHELGHALGIKGHSDSKKDILFPVLQRKVYGRQVGGFPIAIWKSLVKLPSPRDINTLIRLYNHPGTSVRFK